ncbi:unnamed protein product, partial [marine sediment metagenome]
IIKGEDTGEIYIIKKFLRTTIRKFPNLILNKLMNRNIIFVSPQYELTKELTNEQLEKISDFVSHKIAENVRSRM